MEPINPFAIDKLMAETRKIAVCYHQTTGKALPISNELARYDAQRLLSLRSLPEPEKSVDFIGTDKLANEKILVKSRVIFNHQRSGYRMGALPAEGEWTLALLLIYNHAYEPEEIVALHKEALLNELATKKPSRNGFSVAKFKALGDILWDSINGYAP